ncbi:hypothetical protein PT974_09279 [Cladobotryum mycophilum]|uniref:DUF8035 domain-containing protein n=1 Tax=Cladobotryum mycophilum TaxID=491253 RepID=A0ABR0SFR2_9HYPO
MTDRYRNYPLPGRSATFNNPARISLANNLGNYGSAYTTGNEAEFVSSPTRYTVPRAYPATTPSNGVVPPTRAYTSSQESRPSRPSNREPSRNRRSTVDTTARPPIIVTTMQDHHPHNAASHSSAASHSANPPAHNSSPVREPYRASDGKLYTQPASSVRSRSTTRPYHASSASEDYVRPRADRGELVLANREADSYRNSRPSVLYPSDPRHSNAAIDYGDDGYQYTNAGELVKYDLDHDTAPTTSRSRKHERHESFDRGYHRPNINYNADQRSFNVNTTHDLNRHYSMSSRPYDNRGGPPPSTRGFDKINRGFDGTREIPPAAPIPPAPGSTGQSDAGSGPLVRREGRRSRPVSLTQEVGSRASQPEDYYRGHVPDDVYDRPRFYDDSVNARGFGIRLNPSEEPEERHGRYWDTKRDEDRDDPVRDDQRKEKPRRGSDEEAGRGSDAEREEWYRGYKDDGRERPDARRPSDDEPESRSGPSFRDKIATGLGIAASAVGFGASGKKDERKPVPEDREPARRQSLDEPRDQRKGSTQDVEREREPEKNGDMGRKSEADLRERHRREAEAKLSGEAVASASDSDEGRKSSRRRRPSSVFDPNDTGDLKQLKEQLASLNTDDQEPEKERHEKENSDSPERAHSASPTTNGKSLDLVPGDESRSRDLVVHSEAKQVRVVSPPREKKEGKPLKGILKQPSVRFPEDRNPIREGVAPHKDDKKLKDAPAGAKWTKINRKIVNPEALEIGKERYEVRDDFVIVLRVLSKEEIQTYASATQVLRERRRNKENGDRDRDRDQEYDRSYEEYEQEFDEDRGRRNSHHHRRHKDDEEGAAEDWTEDRERERRRRSKRDDDEYNSRTRDTDHHRHRSHRERA